MSKPASRVRLDTTNPTTELDELAPRAPEYDPIVQSMHDEARRDGKHYYRRLLDEAAADVRAQYIDHKMIKDFLNARYEQTKNNRHLVIRKLNKIYDWLREYHFTWEREVLMLYLYFDHPGWPLIQAMFYIFTCKAVIKRN